jgi:AXL receptor tyrosine kinase
MAAPVSLLKSLGYEIPHERLQYGKLLGRTLIAEVYEGTWNAAPVAIKRWKIGVLPTQLEKVWDVYCLVRHPNIVNFYGNCINSGNFCSVYELMPTTLYGLITKSNRLSSLVILAIGKDIGIALEFLHNKRIYHDNLRDTNVLLMPIETGGYLAKLGDFAIGEIKLNTAPNQSDETATVRYRGPETLTRGWTQIKKTAEGLKGKDIYAYGALLWEMCAHKRPYANDSESLIIEKINAGIKEIIPNDCLSGLTAIIRKCWDDNYLNRPSAEEVKKDLSRLF